MANGKPDSLEQYMTVPDGIELLKKFSQSLVRFLSWGEVQQLSTIAQIFNSNPEFKAWSQKWLVPNTPKVVGWVGKSFDAQAWKLAAQMATPGKTVERSNNPVHNWTLSPEVAKTYAMGSSDKSTKEHAGGYVAKQEISKNDILLAVNEVAKVFAEWQNSEWGQRLMHGNSSKGKEFMKWVVSLHNSAAAFKEEQEILADGKVHSPVVVQRF
jgi:hypothetical protein